MSTESLETATPRETETLLETETAAGTETLLHLVANVQLYACASSGVLLLPAAQRVTFARAEAVAAAVPAMPAFPICTTVDWRRTRHVAIPATLSYLQGVIRTEGPLFSAAELLERGIAAPASLSN
jgi:hypothetical protein